MSTKVSIIWETEPKELKPIEFKKYLSRDGELLTPPNNPGSFANVQLITAKGEYYYDVMMAWDSDTGNRFIYLGYWNDGVVAPPKK